MPRAGGAGRWDAAAIWIAVAAVGLFLVGLAFRFDEIVDGIYGNADYSSTPVIAQVFDGRGSGDVTLGNYLWVEPLYVLRLTEWLPDHRQIWNLLPFIGYGCTILLFAWTLRRAVSSRAALVGALALACPAPFILGLVGAPANRMPTLAHAILLAAFLVALPALASRPGWVRALWAAALAISLAPGVASDPLLILWAVIPLLAAAAAGWRLALISGRNALLAAGAALGGVIGGRLLAAVAGEQGIHKAPFPIHSAAPGEWPSSAWDALRTIAQFLHGDLVLDDLGDPLGAAEFLLGALAIAGAVVLLVVVLYRLRGLLADPDRSREQRLLLVFWTTSLLITVVAVVGTDVAAGVGTVRYLLIAWPGLLALAMIVWQERSLAAIACLAAASAVIGFVQLERGGYDVQGLEPDEPEVSGIERFVAANDLDHGYAGYWDAAPITYLSDYRALTYSVDRCGATGTGFCQFLLHSIDAWYVPREGERTFFVYDTRDIPVNPGPPPPRWGPPIAQARDGRLRLYAYDFDLASVLPEGTVPGARR